MIRQRQPLSTGVKRAILILIIAVLIGHMISLLFSAWYIQPYTTMPLCYREADPSYPAEFTVASSGMDIVSFFPLGVNCIYGDPVTHLEIGRHGPRTWGPTIDAGVTIMALVVMVLIGIAWRRKDLAKVRSRP